MSLTREQRLYLNGVDDSELWDVMDVASVLHHVRRMRSSYQMADTTIAQFLLEMTSGVQQYMQLALAEEGATVEQVRASINIWLSEIVLIAAALTRKQRGKKPLEAA